MKFAAIAVILSVRKERYQASGISYQVVWMRQQGKSSMMCINDIIFIHAAQPPDCKLTPDT